MYTSEEIKSYSESLYGWCIQTRREFHRIPEPGYRENKTKALIHKKLNQIGIKGNEENGWITAYIPGTRSGPVTALRGDFDGLPIMEPAGCGFESQHPGYMHACGHDMHTTLLLATAKLLINLPNGFPGGCLLLFEPAEETEGGAKPMAASGIMEKYHTNRVYGLHVMPRLVTGQIETRPLTLNAGTDEISIIVHGTASHGAYPENGKDAIVCAAQLICALQTVVSRTVSPLENSVLTIGTIQGGKANNILCDEVILKGTLRTADSALRSKISERMNDICHGVGQAFGCNIDLRLKKGYSALVNSPEHANRILDTASRLFGLQSILVKEAPSMGAEDFSEFLDHAPGAFFHIGCSPDAEHIGAPLHSELFNPDERAMFYGLCMETALVLNQ